MEGCGDETERSSREREISFIHTERGGDDTHG